MSRTWTRSLICDRFIFEHADTDRHDDGGGNLDLCLEIQRYYQRNKFATRVKAAALVNVDEAKRLAGVAAVTVAPDLLRALADTEELASETARISIFEDQNAQTLKTVHERETFVNDERKYREAFARSNGGKGAQRTKEVRKIPADDGGVLTRLERRSTYSESTRSRQRPCCVTTTRLATNSMTFCLSRKRRRSIPSIIIAH